MCCSILAAAAFLFSRPSVQNDFELMHAFDRPACTMEFDVSRYDDAIIYRQTHFMEVFRYLVWRFKNQNVWLYYQPVKRLDDEIPEPACNWWIQLKISF